MPALRNPRREKFAQNIVAGMKAEDAYAAAGYKAHRQNAHRMMTNDDIRARIEELRAPVVETIQWDCRVRLEMLRDIALAARKGNDHRAAIAAIAESNRMDGTYKLNPKEEAEASQANALSELLEQVVQAKPALPIGRPQLHREHQDVPPGRGENGAASKAGNLTRLWPLGNQTGEGDAGTGS